MVHPTHQVTLNGHAVHLAPDHTPADVLWVMHHDMQNTTPETALNGEASPIRVGCMGQDANRQTPVGYPGSTV